MIMRFLEDTDVVLPPWVRVGFVALTAAFGALAIWLTSMAETGWVAIAGAALAAGVGLLLLSAAVKGRIWRWMWFIPWLPTG